jgi:hypothetical protein
MATKPKRPTYTSPKGIFKYPALSKPDYGNAEFPKPDGEFKTGLVVSLADPAVQALIATLQPLWDAAIVKGKEEYAKLKVDIRKKLGGLKEQPFYETEYDQQTEVETGNVIFKFKTKFKIVDKKDQSVRFNKIGLFDAKGKPLGADTLIYGGTVGKIAFQVSDYFVAGQGMAGISLRLSAAQVIELVGPGNRSASSYGFGEEEGFEASDEGDAPAGFDPDVPAAGASGDRPDF